MHAHIALVVLLAPALLAARLGYEREIHSTHYNQVPKLLDYVISDQYLANQRNRAKLVTRLRPEEPIAADNVILESNVVKIVKPARQLSEEGEALVRRRRGYNLENVQVPARYPYLPVPRFDRFRRWGYGR